MKEKGKNSTQNKGTSDLNIAGPKLRRQDYENRAIFKTQIGEKITDAKYYTYKLA